MSLALIVGCASAPSQGRLPLPAPDTWPDEERAGFVLFRRLLTTDTHTVAGRLLAIRRLARALENGGVQVLEKSDVLVATIPGRGGRTPLLLLGHVDTWPAEPGAWPKDTGPTSGAVKGGAIYGQGALGGKGAASVFSAVLAQVALGQFELDQPIYLVVTSDGLNPLAEQLSRVLASFPELARAFMALGPGGFVVVRPGQSPSRMFVPSVGELGFARYLITAVGADASGRLAAALGKLPDALPHDELGRAALRYLSDLAETTNWPDRWFMQLPQIARLFYTGPMGDRPWTRSLVRWEARVEYVGRPKSLSVAPQTRARAWLQVYLLESESPASLRTRLRARLGEGIHVDLFDGEPLYNVGADSIDLRALQDVFGGKVWARTIGEPSQSRLLSRIGVPTFGFVPMEVSPNHLEDRGRPGERAPLRGLRAALQILPSALLALTQSKTSTASQGGLANES